MRWQAINPPVHQIISVQRICTSLLFNYQRSIWLLQAKKPIHLCTGFTPSNNLGGGERDRTDDLLRARQALSQLSYTPNIPELVGLGGLEPPTSRLSGVRSNQLSYRPSSCVTKPVGIVKALP